MWFLTGIYALLFYVATLVLIAGLANKIIQYVRTPSPLKVPTMPAPMTQSGVVLRVLQEVVLFKSLFRSNKWIWLFGYIFHAALLLVLLRHLRYFVSPDFIDIIWQGIMLVQPFGKYAGFGMIVGLGGLLLRRIFVARIKYISSPSDYLMLVLLLFIGVTGLLMDFVVRTDIVQLTAFMRGLMTFSWQLIPADGVLLLHLTSVILLMLIFPFSKLLHAPGVFFSPSRNQVDDSRKKRHLASWAAELEK